MTADDKPMGAITDRGRFRLEDPLDKAERIADQLSDPVTPNPMREPIRLTVDTHAGDTVQILDLIRRVRLFADEMVQAGHDVAIDGHLSITVRVKP